MYVSTGCRMSLSIRENNPLQGVIRIRQTMRVPEDIQSDGNARSARYTDLTIETDVILRKGSRFVEFETCLDNTAKSHRCGSPSPRTSRATRAIPACPST